MVTGIGNIKFRSIAVDATGLIHRRGAETSRISGPIIQVGLPQHEVGLSASVARDTVPNQHPVI